MLVEERRTRLLDLVRQRGFASLPDLSRELEVSESTVRRDLDHLERIGQARRTHGGVFYTGAAPRLPPFEERQPAEWDKKQLIAEAVSGMIADGETVLIDGGTTTYEVARRLVGRPLQVVTNSLPVANLFASDSQTDLVILGGYVYPRTGVALGPYADTMLEQIRVQKTVLSVGGVTSEGFFNSNVLLVNTERAMIRAADEVIVAVDSTKFGRQNLAFLGQLAEADCVVVDDDLPPHWQQQLAQAGIRLTLALTPQAPGDTADRRDS